MNMEFSVGMGRNLRIDEVQNHSIVAENSGFAQLTFIDSQNLCRDVYSMMTIAALNTNKIKIGHGVTTPSTRHPSVTANATATVDELSGGRAFIGMGTGFSAVLTMGKKARPVSELRETIQFLHKYMNGQTATFKNSSMNSEWIRKRVPIYIGVVGPKALQTAGELADGVIFSGLHPEMVKWNIEQVHKGAERIGRDPSEIELWNRTLIYITDRKEDAHREVASYAGTGLMAKYQVLIRDTPEVIDLRNRIEKVQPGLLEDIYKLAKVWNNYDHEKTDALHSKAVTQRMIDFMHLTGKPDDICEQIEKLEQLGVTNISTTVFTIVDKKGMMQEIGDKIIPRFSN